jgi:hypothetical protein
MTLETSFGRLKGTHSTAPQHSDQLFAQKRKETKKKVPLAVSPN